MSAININSDQLMDAVDLLFKSSQMMVPVMTGFIVFVSAIVGKLRDSAESEINYKLLKWIFSLSIVALLLWVGVTPFCYMAALGYDQPVWTLGISGENWEGLLGLHTPSELFALGRNFALLGQIAFILAVILTSKLCLQVILGGKSSRT